MTVLSVSLYISSESLHFFSSSSWFIIVIIHINQLYTLKSSKNFSKAKTVKYLILIPIIPKLCCCFSIEQEKKKFVLYCKSTDAAILSHGWYGSHYFFRSLIINMQKKFWITVVLFLLFETIIYYTIILHYNTTLINKAENQFEIIYNKTYLEKTANMYQNYNNNNTNNNYYYINLHIIIIKN